MTHHPSRKQFFAKLFGAAASIAVLPKLFAKPAASVTTPSERAPASAPKAEAMPVKVRPDRRAVARRGEAI